MKNLLFIITCLLMITLSCTSDRSKEKEKRSADTAALTVESPPPVLEIQTDKSVDIRVFQTENQGWGYDIYLNGKLYVHQPHIPAVSGVMGFSTEEDARKTAELVSYKLENNRSLPSVTIRELDSLGVLPQP